MAINNPYVPGDPFSYDLKWIVRKIKEHQIILDGLDERIQNAIIAALENLDQLGSKYFENAADLISSDLKDKSIAYIEGFYAPADGGANLYYVTTDYNDIIGADFYLTLDGPNRWALPIIVTPYVTPEMFGAKADGSTNDHDAFATALKFGTVSLMPGKIYEVDYQEDLIVSNPLHLYGNGSTIQGFTLKADGVDGITIEDLNITEANKSLNFDNCSNVFVKDCTFTGQSTFASPRFVILRNCEHATVEGCLVTNTQYGIFMQVYQLGRSKDVTVSKCRFVNTQKYSYPAGVAIYEADQVRVSDCYFYNIQHEVSPFADGYGVYSGDYEYNDIGSVTVENCQIDNCGRGIRMHHSEKMIISNCTVTNSIQQAIIIDAAVSLGGDPMKGAVISNNCLTSYIDISGACDNALVTGNTITGTYGVFVGSTGTPPVSPKNPSIIGNHILDTSRGGIVIDIAEDPVVLSNDITNFNTSAYSSSDYRSAGIGFNTQTTNPTAIGNSIRKPAASTFAINFVNTSTKRVYKANSFDMETNSILGGYNGAPTQGKWARGESVDYVNPATPNYIGAVCTVSGDFAGTPPTFKQYGALV